MATGWEPTSVGYIQAAEENEPEFRHAGNAVGNHVVQSHKPANTVSRQPREEPHLPEWPRLVQRAPSQPRHCPQQLRLVGWGLKSLDVDVVAQVERRCINPQRPTEASPGYEKDLTEPAEEVQPTFDRVLRGLDPEAAVGFEEVVAVKDTERTDVLRPCLVRPQDKPVFCAQPLHRRHLTSMPGSCGPG